MTQTSLPGFRTEPDPTVTTATRAPAGPTFRKADRQFGWLVINGWTYRIFRALSSKVLPKVDLSGVSVTDEPTAGRGMKIVRPDTVTGEGAVLLIHGGGYVVGTPGEVVGLGAILARHCGVPVVCPAYRLGPEDPFPAGLDDCHAGWQWLLDHSEGLGIDSSKVVIGGVSAGGGLAAGLVQRVHDEGGIQPAAQLLLYPMLDAQTAARRDLDKPRHRVWSNRNNLFGWTSYLGHAPYQPAKPYAVPSQRDDLSGLPPAWIGVGTPDLFLDEDREYARRLREAGVEVEYVEVDGGIHGFNGVADTPLGRAFDASAAAFTARYTA